MIDILRFLLISHILGIIIFSSCNSNVPPKDKKTYIHQEQAAGNPGEYLDKLLDKLDIVYGKDAKFKELEVAKYKLRTSLEELKSGRNAKLKSKKTKKIVQAFCKELSAMNMCQGNEGMDFPDSSKLKSNQWNNFLLQHLKMPTDTLFDVTKKTIIKDRTNIDPNYKKKVEKSIKAAKDYINAFIGKLEDPTVCDSVIENIKTHVLECDTKNDKALYFANVTMRSFKDQVMVPLEKGLEKMKSKFSKDKFDKAKRHYDKIFDIYIKYIPNIKELLLLLPKVIDDTAVKSLDLKEPILSTIVFAIELQNILYSMLDEALLPNDNDIQWKEKLCSISKYVKAMEKLKKLKYFLTNITIVKVYSGEVKKYIKLHYKIKELEYSLLLALVNAIKDNREWVLLSLKCK